ncbi:YveK family protein [Micromonospora pallida]|uniref:YveK family protein n=1 Tax=Micromonospora pallida TaxID=145854 RepID=UPI000A42DC34|nr:polysaccharide biosynthesis tyrosine autokinase [Micromonospora pallida]
MDLRTYLQLIRRQWWIVLATVLVALGVAGYLTVRAEPRYVASVTFFVTTPSQGVTDAYQGNLWLQQRVKSYADLLRSERLARAVAADPALGLTPAGVQDRVDASLQTGTVLIEARVTDTDRQRALRVAQVVAVKFADLVKTVETPPEGRSSVKMEVVSGPGVGAEPVSPRVDRNLLLGGLLGLLAGIGLAVLRGLVDTRLRDGETLQRATGSPLLGEIPFDADARTSPLIVGDAATSARAESVRKLRTNLRFVDVHEPARIIAVTSALQGEGKTTLSCNLAITLAEAGWRVLLVDADLRRPRVAEYLGLEQGIGLTDVLLGDVQVGDVVQRWGTGPCWCSPAAPTRRTPASCSAPRPWRTCCWPCATRRTSSSSTPLRCSRSPTGWWWPCRPTAR